MGQAARLLELALGPARQELKTQHNSCQQLPAAQPYLLPITTDTLQSGCELLAFANLHNTLQSPASLLDPSHGKRIIPFYCSILSGVAVGMETAHYYRQVMLRLGNFPHCAVDPTGFSADDKGKKGLENSDLRDSPFLACNDIWSQALL